MPTGSTRSSVSLERLVEVCERFYARDGFVKWTDVGAALGVSRQAVQLRLKAATERGDIAPETVERWQSMSSKAAAARERRESRNLNIVRVQLDPECFAWLKEEAAFRRCKTSDILNGLINRERQATAAANKTD